MMLRYNESADTFSFALVLLSLAAGDIGYIKKRGRLISRSSYALGWRPPIPSELGESCPDLAKLIAEMWDGDFRKRPTLKAIVPRLEAAFAANFDDIEPTFDEGKAGGGGKVDLAATIAALRAENDAQAEMIVSMAAEAEIQAAKIAALEQGGGGGRL